MKVIIFDFEVYQEDWGVIFRDVATREDTEIRNDVGALRAFWEANSDAIFTGYNVKHYDSAIFKGLLGYLNPKEISQWIIEQGNPAYMFPGMKAHYFLPIKLFDLKNDVIKPHNFAMSLKEYEAYLGSNIHECEIPFDYPYKLTNEQMDIVMDYCKSDIDATEALFNEPAQREELLTQMRMCSLIKEPLHKTLHKTTAQLTAKLLGAEKQTFFDEAEYTFPDTLRLENQEVRDFFSQPIKHGMELKLEYHGLTYVFGLGGLHAAKDNYISKDTHLMIDVGSYYPSLMIVYRLYPRSILDSAKFEKIYYDRIELKKQGHPQANIYKRVLNTTYGAADSKYNELFDTRMRRSIAITGQLLLFDLVEKLIPYGVMVNVNTDGIMMKPHNFDDMSIINSIVKEWEERTKMTMDYEHYTDVIQANVNNYILKRDDGEIKVKGTHVKFYNKIVNFKRQLRIVETATVEYLLNDVPIEDTIRNPKNIMDYIYTAKATGAYQATLNINVEEQPNYKDMAYTTFPQLQKVNRMLATTDKTQGAVIKWRMFKGKSSYTKFLNAPTHAYILNDKLNLELTPEQLKGIFEDFKVDYKYYEELAWKRVAAFKGKKETKQLRLELGHEV